MNEKVKKAYVLYGTTSNEWTLTSCEYQKENKQVESLFKEIIAEGDSRRWRSRWTWSLSLSTDASGVHL